MSTFGDLIVLVDLLFLDVDEEVGDEGDGLFLHDAVHVFLSDFDANDGIVFHILMGEERKGQEGRLVEWKHTGPTSGEQGIETFTSYF